jgi:hypothetical protein
VTATPPAVVGALVSILGLPLAASGQSLTAQGAELATVEVTVGAIIANNSSEWLDHRVTAMHPRFPTLFPYSSFRLVREERQSVPWGGTVRLDISGTRYVIVVPRGISKKRVSMRVRLIDIGVTRPVLDTTIALQDRGTLLVGGPRETDGVLILAIGAATLR